MATKTGTSWNITNDAHLDAELAPERPTPEIRGGMTQEQAMHEWCDRQERQDREEAQGVQKTHAERRAEADFLRSSSEPYRRSVPER